MFNLDWLEDATNETANNLAPILLDTAKQIWLSRDRLVLRNRVLAQSGFDSLATLGCVHLG